MSMQLNTYQIRESNWIITASQFGTEWRFHSLPPDGEPLTDDKSYSNSVAALSAGRRFVQKAIVRLQIGIWIDGLLESKRIDSEEYVTAMGLIAHLTRD